MTERIEGWLKRYFVAVTLTALLVKGALLLWTVHPFDFWTFVNTIQRSTLYDWNVFEFWNKGNLLILLWYPLYALYLAVLNLLSFQVDTLPLLFLFFKLPFLLVDVGCGYLLYLIVRKLGQPVSMAKLVFLSWFLNPLAFYVYGVHGHYELLVPLALLAILYGVVAKKGLPLGLGVLLAFTTKYFIVIIIPFIVLYLLINRLYRLFWLSSGVFVGGLILSYIHIFLYPELFSQVTQSIIHLSSTNAALGVQKLSIPALNIFSALNYIFYQSTPINNLQYPTLFALASRGMTYAALLTVAHLGYRSFMIRIRRQEYSVWLFIADFGLLLSYFLLTVTNFQPHYLVWCLPLYLLIWLKDQRMMALLIPYTVTGFIFAFKNELGPRTFFQDLGGYVGAQSLSQVSPLVMYGTAAVCVFSMVLAIVLIMQNLKQWHSHSRNGMVDFYLIGMVALWGILVLPYIQLIKALPWHHLPHELSYARLSGFHKGALYTEYFIEPTSSGNELIFTDQDDSGSLLAQEIERLPAETKHYFKSYIVLHNQTEEGRIFQSLAGASYNSCATLAKEPTLITLLAKGATEYPAFEVSIDCLKAKGNKLVLSQPLASLENGRDIALYLSNEPVYYTATPSMRVTLAVMAAVGALYLASFAGVGWWILKRLNREEGEKGSL